MAQSLSNEYLGTLYHVISGGNEKLEVILSFSCKLKTLNFASWESPELQKDY